MHEVNVRFYDSALAAGERPEFRIRTAHLPTPETATSTHYFVVHGRDFALADAELGEYMHTQLFKAFDEDVQGLALQELNYASAAPGECYEFSVAADGPAVAARRYLTRRAEGRAPAPGVAGLAGEWRRDGIADHHEVGHLGAPGRRCALPEGRCAGRQAGQQARHAGTPRGGPSPAAHARRRSWSFSGSCRMRLPVAAKIAFSTAGAATAIVGSPTPPQKPPEGTSTVSTAGMCRIITTG